VASIGEAADLSYPVEHLGEGAAALAGLLKGGPVLERLQAAERPAIIVGPGMLARPDRAAVLQQARGPGGPPPAPLRGGRGWFVCASPGMSLSENQTSQGAPGCACGPGAPAAPGRWLARCSAPTCPHPRPCPAGQVHELVEKAGVVKEGWNGYNVLHDMASRVGALDIGFLPSARASAPGAPPPKVVYLLGSDDYADADVPAGAFVIYQARPRRCACPKPPALGSLQVAGHRQAHSRWRLPRCVRGPLPARAGMHAGEVGMLVTSRCRCHAGRPGMHRLASPMLAAMQPESEREGRATRAGAPRRPRRGARGRGPAERRLHREDGHLRQL
jgi:hypothetical protein